MPKQPTTEPEPQRAPLPRREREHPLPEPPLPDPGRRIEHIEPPEPWPVEPPEQ
jgi:hypothetical protein